MKSQRSSRGGAAFSQSTMSPTAQSGRISSARIARVCLAALPALWIVTAPTAANILANANPVLAMTIWPWNVEARAKQAGAMVALKAPTAKLKRARQLAWSALAREPLNVSAVRVIGLSEDIQRRPGAGPLFAYAESLSRRDFATQLWMIESLVAKNDIEGTLVHYDRALRTRKEAEPLLLPILVSASATVDTREPIGRLIATRPQWWPRFMEQALADPVAVPALPFIFTRLRLSPSDEQSRGFLSTGIASLISSGRYADALAVYRRAMPREKGPDAVLHDGSFDRDPMLPPFDWQLANGDDVSALIQTGPGNNRVLFAVPTEGARGEFARQLLVLPAARYQLAYRSGSLPANGVRMSLKIQCVLDGKLRDIAMRQFSPAPEAGRSDSLPFTVTADACAAQWIILSVDNPGSVPETLPWIDDLRIERIPG